MSWKIRHEGSPQAVEGLTLPQIVEGLQDGHWEPTDEVQGPQDQQWLPIESHPALEEVVLDMEPPPPRVEEDESRLDMNPLIDVCLVLLVFFIMTTSYAAIQKMLDTPDASSDKRGPAIVKPDMIKERMIKVEVRQEGGQTVFKIEGQPVTREALLPMLRQFTRESNKSELLLDHDFDAPHGAVVAVQDAAKGAKIEKVLVLVPEAELKR
jgi:biopolymer transport protein ExbD